MAFAQSRSRPGTKRPDVHTDSHIIGALAGTVGASREVSVLEPCVLCQYLGEPATPGTSLVSLETTLGPLRALMPTPDAHGAIATRLCPEHVIDVYRGRVEGVTMAWRVLAHPVASR